MEHAVRFQLENVDSVKATLSITATVSEWRDFVLQSESQRGMGLEKLGNCYLVSFGSAVQQMLRAVEKRYKDSAADIEDVVISLDSLAGRP